MENQNAQLINADCLEALKLLPDASVDSIVTDPPYELGFMGKSWDATGIAYSVGLWRETLRVLKPGGHLLAFGGSRTYHRLACAVEDAGFDIRDQIMWLYGSGFPKSLDVSKAIDKSAGMKRCGTGEIVRAGCRAAREGGELVGSGTVEEAKWKELTVPATDEARQWDGWGTALKPAHEPIVVARKPLIGIVAENVLTHGTGALNIDGCRVAVSENDDIFAKNPHTHGGFGHANAKIYGEGKGSDYQPGDGRWPANVIHDGSEEVLAGLPITKSGSGIRRPKDWSTDVYGMRGKANEYDRSGDTGSAARFFYCAKASKSDRGDGNTHPTVKPTELMRYLCRLVTPPAGVVLDPFLGSGSTGKAALLEGFRFIGIEKEPEYYAIACSRIRGDHEPKEVAQLEPAKQDAAEPDLFSFPAA